MMKAAGFPLPRDVDSESKDLPIRSGRNRLDQLTESLGCTSFYHKMRWPWLVYPYGGMKHPLDVFRFYQEKSLAIDVGTVPTDIRDLKKSLCAEHNIQYVVINDSYDVEGLRKELQA